jgi:hypothetical protein
MKVNFDIVNKTFSLDLEEIDPYQNYVDTKFSFTENEKPEANFIDLSFGYSLFGEEDTLGVDSYPKENIKYFSSDQEYLELSRVFGFTPNKEYTLSVWASNNNENFSETFVFEFPKPAKPFSSWIWNDESISWEAPIPYPGGHGEPFYVWNEESQAWDIAIPKEES